METTAMQEPAGRRISVIGLGRFGGGLGVTRWLIAQGAKVTVSDAAPADKLQESLAALAGLPVTLHLGGHREADFLDADLLILNPAIPRELPALQRALSGGAAWTTEMNLFLERCRGRLVGITGSAGKSTTTAMIGECLRRRFTVHVGGNIGRSLLEDLPAIRPEHVVVLELSSFQLDDVPQVGVSPAVALVTNLAPNHLDRHGTMDAYAAAKRNIFRFQKAGDVLVLNRACPLSSPWAAVAPGRVEFFDGSLDRDAAEPFDLLLPGRHNQADAQAAWAVVQQLGVSRAEAAQAMAAFRGLPHRLQLAGERGGVRYFNDSKCTTPQGAIVALESFPYRSAVMIVGGYDKHVSMDELGAALAARAKAIVAVGQTREMIVAAVRRHCESAPIQSAPGQSAPAERAAGACPPIVCSDSFDAAVRSAADLAGPGDAVLLSPACASYDMFTNYEQRGRRFIELVTNAQFPHVVQPGPTM